MGWHPVGDIEGCRLRIDHDRRFPCQGSPAWDRRKRGRFNQEIGRSAGGLTSKIHALVDALGNPLRICLTGGNVHDLIPALDLVSNQSADSLLGDKAYDADQFIAKVQSQGIKIVIPPKSNRRKMRDYDRHIYKERHLVECFFAKIKQYRRIATRYEKLALTFRAVVLITACLVWLE